MAKHGGHTSPIPGIIPLSPLGVVSPSPGSHSQGTFQLKCLKDPSLPPSRGVDVSPPSTTRVTFSWEPKPPQKMRNEPYVVEVTQPVLEAECHQGQGSLGREGWTQAALTAAP